MASENKSEKATPRRRQKARERGQVARSRELPAALVMLTVVFFLWWQLHVWREQWYQLFRQVLAVATGDGIGDATALLERTFWLVGRWAVPTMLFGWLVAVVGATVQGGFVFAPKALSIKLSKLNPVENLKKLFSIDGFSRMLKSFVPLGFILYQSVTLLQRDWDQIIFASRTGIHSSLALMLNLVFEVSWKAGLVLLFWAGLDYVIQYISFERNLRMSRQEVTDESKEAQGNPLVRGRIRRLQREMRRRRLAVDVAQATAVVTNPNEYAVAIEYDPETMDAPVVLAKGRNLLAQEIKKIARWHGIPLVENPPLAQALYRAVEVGQQIPAKLYAAVAEILAFIFRTQARLQARGAPVAAGSPIPGVL